MKHTLIIQIFRKWWYIDVMYDRLDLKLIFPSHVMHSCYIIYDVTTNTIIKDRTGNGMNTATLLRYWMKKDLPEFKWEGYKQFRNDLSEYYQTLKNET